MELNCASLTVWIALAACWSIGAIASAVKDTGSSRRDAMADILYENRRINKAIARGRMEHILIEGDIKVHPSNNSSRSRRTVTTREGMKWPGAVVPYIVDTAFKDREKRIIFSAMQRFHEETCIKFRKRTIEPDYLFVTPGKGCWSMVGRQGGMQKLSLFGTCKVRKGTIMHELMHCLGFRHEHNRPDRDSFIRIMWRNIENGYSENFVQHSYLEVDTMDTPYDYFSIMHYPLSAFSSNDQWTIQPYKLQHGYFLVGSRHDFSRQDISRVNKLYKCGACSDTDSLYCPVWAMRGECQRNVAWMAEHCALSCDRCPETDATGNTVIDHNCIDKNDQCPQWAQRGECSRNPSYMERHCQRSCQLCPSDIRQHLEDMSEEEDSECKDSNSLCPEWAVLGECSSSRYMKANCKASCQFCKDSKVKRVCQDNEVNCAAWAREGFCDTHTAYMLKNCRKSCGVCTTAVQVTRQQVRHRNIGEITNEMLDETGHREENEDDGTTVNYCTDLHATCSQWAMGNDCVTNSQWMAINCPNSCGLCGNSGLESACVDRHRNCSLWVKEGDCKQFPEWMLDKCPASCNFCSRVSAVPTVGPNVGMVKCRDKKKQCATWADSGHCEEYRHWMTFNCPKSCDECGTIIDKSCVDKEKKCSQWATKKECKKNKGWFIPNCQFTCNACSEAVPTCVDQNRTCRKKAKKGLCEKKSKVRKECPYSCNLCDD